MDVLLEPCGRRRVKPLLLLYLFVANAAADCPKPRGREYTVLTDAALLINDFPEGISVTLECTNGYVKESGSDTITCIQGNWTEQDLTCKKKDCGPPKPKPNMSFNISAGTLLGAAIGVVCNKGYQLSGSSFQFCYASGWSGRSKCEIITCDPPGEVTNGRNSWDSEEYPKYGEIIHYFCNKGYTLVGKDNIMCSETGEYDSPPPQCKDMSATTDSPATPTAHRGKTITTSPTPTVSPSLQEASTTTDSPAKPTAHRDKTITTSPTPPVSPSVQGGRGILAPEEKATTTSVTSTTLFQDKHNGTVETNKDIEYIPAISISICILGALCIGALVLYKYLLKRKGSYDTREDLKPELLQFQNL